MASRPLKPSSAATGVALSLQKVATPVDRETTLNRTGYTVYPLQLFPHKMPDHLFKIWLFIFHVLKTLPRATDGSLVSGELDAYPGASISSSKKGTK